MPIELLFTPTLTVTMTTVSHSFTKLFAAAICVAIVASVGCSSTTATIYGTVTFEGQDVEKGMMTFTPADGSGSVVGCDIKNGKFYAKGVTPGRNVLLVTAVKQVTFARSSEEMAQMAQGPAAQEGIVGLIDPADLIPSNAEGNNQIHTFQTGSNQLELAIKKSK
ncbi:MAG: hypothetical protein FJ308_09005 [Planctomycetes bacterium]|nr:hypothetical protein [Planctomycetota bacterium]